MATVAALAARGLNLGVDFAGGTLIEARATRSQDIAAFKPGGTPAVS